ncbi:MAG TPA: polysaccharide biosynthesis protein [Patescibacteria group bacterium]
MENIYKEAIKGKVILITGGTGSFGNSVVGKLTSYAPKRIIIVSRDEKKQFDMRNKFNSPLLKFVIGDVRDKDSFKSYFENVDYVFHAAALKQVPTCEFFPIEAVKTNILGAHNVIETAIEYKVKRLVILSTDKAVYPINAMGMSKALMEKTMIAAARKITEAENSQTVLCGVRYGNVLYSRGSVLPYFVDLMKENKKLQITNPQMTRFLLPLEKAVDLVLYAMTKGKNGDMYVRKAPAATIETLAKAMCQLFDYKRGYEEVGIRAGEKMHESLVSQEEMFRAVDQGNYFRVPSESQGLDYNKYFKRGETTALEKIESYTSANTERLTVDQTIALLKTIPEIKEEMANFAK